MRGIEQVLRLSDVGHKEQRVAQLSQVGDKGLTSPAADADALFLHGSTSQSRLAYLQLQPGGERLPVLAAGCMPEVLLASKQREASG
jgi:hypothetical protein